MPLLTTGSYLTRECESSEPEGVACGRNPDGCAWYPESRITERRMAGPKPAKRLPDSGFSQAL